MTVLVDRRPEITEDMRTAYGRRKFQMDSQEQHNFFLFTICRQVNSERNEHMGLETWIEGMTIWNIIDGRPWKCGTGKYLLN